MTTEGSNSLYFQSSPAIRFATNTFINVPTILQYDETPLIEVVSEKQIGLTTQISIYHSDGTYLAKVKGPRIFPTKAGEKAGLVMRHPAEKRFARWQETQYSNLVTKGLRLWR